MTYYDAWITQPSAIADLDWQGSSSSRSAAIGCSPMFPEGKVAFFAIRDGIKSGRFHGAQVDHLVWAAVMTRNEIVTFLAEVFGPPGRYEQHHDDGLRHLSDRMRELRSFVARLPGDEAFAIVAEEF